MSAATTLFRVIARDVHGDPVRCSCCSRDIQRVVVLPIADPIASEGQLRVDGGTRWLGACAFCVLDMAKALRAAEEKR